MQAYAYADCDCGWGTHWLELAKDTERDKARESGREKEPFLNPLDGTQKTMVKKIVQA